MDYIGDYTENECRFFYAGAKNAQDIVATLLVIYPRQFFNHAVLDRIDTYLIGSDNFCHVCGLKGGH